MARVVSVGVLALQGAFHEHLQLFKAASEAETFRDGKVQWRFSEIRTAEQLSRCDALVIPGGESTTMALVAERSGILEPLREFVKVQRRPTWGTCAGLILLAESANRTKKGGQDLIGGLDVRVNRNHFGRQIESFETDLVLPFLSTNEETPAANPPFRAVFIRAPVVEKLLPVIAGEQRDEAAREDTVIAPSKPVSDELARRSIGQPVEVLATLPGRRSRLSELDVQVDPSDEAGDIVAVRQGNVFGCSFHPELTRDARMHVWWLQQVKTAIERD